MTVRKSLSISNTHIGARDGECVRDFIGMQRLGGEKQQRVDLRDGAVETPATAHLAPVNDVALHGVGEVHIVLPVISVLTEIIDASIMTASGQ